MQMTMQHLTTIVFTILCLIYGYFKYAHGYWSRRGVPNIPAYFPFGNISQVILRKKSFTEKMQEFYIKMKVKGHSYVGLYFFSRKILLIIDPELVKNVITTKFHHFHDRGLYYDENNEPLSANLVVLEGNKWKSLRSKLTPTFTSGKLKVMFEIVAGCAIEMIDLLNRQESVEIKELAARYTTDVIGSCAFGIDCNSLKNPNAEFRQIGRRMFQEKPIDIIKRLFVRSFPSLAKIFKLKLFDSHVSTFFMNAVVDTVKYRNINNVHRNDFMQLLIELMDKENKENTEEPLTMNEAAAQAFVFFLAGFETSASTITFALYELASNKDIQNKLRIEILQMLQKNNGKIAYNGITEMPYMEKVVQETLRKWPVITLLLRKCTKDYQLPGTNTIIEKGIPVVIPIHAMHQDPEFYPNPTMFDPERFESDIVKKRNDYTYLPFGSGPRICIGLRFAMVQVKVALSTLLQHFEFTVNEKTKCPLVMDKSSFNLNPVGGIWLNVTPVAKE